jgi:SAM-dependent methyltransferase
MARCFAERVKGWLGRRVGGWRRLWPRQVRVDAILRGGEAGIPAGQYARLTGDLLRPSTRVMDGPHVELLRLFAQEGWACLAPGRFEQTRYYANACECLRLIGWYFFSVRRPEQVREVAGRFLKQFGEGQPVPDGTEQGHSPRGDPILLRPILDSKCYELVDGNHRLAKAVVSGSEFVRAAVMGAPVSTPMQDLLRDVLWQESRREVYQPVPFPEVGGWHVVRRCDDRLARMLECLAEKGITEGSYLDLGSSYGWFVAAMKQRGYRAQGVERDPAAIRVGQFAYGLGPDEVWQGDLLEIVSDLREPRDVVSLFSVVHHAMRGRMAVGAEELVRLVFRATRRVLFFDTGQEHEEWFRSELAGWNVERIEGWLRSHTGCREVWRLGVDADARGNYRRNFRRTLFACVR